MGGFGFAGVLFMNIKGRRGGDHRGFFFKMGQGILNQFAFGIHHQGAFEHNNFFFWQIDEINHPQPGQLFFGVFF